MGETRDWLKFFEDSGIPRSAAANYAVTFIENRITMDMLMDLNKEYLRDMGIVKLGDIISILKHAKIVNEKFARDKALKTNTRIDEAVSPPLLKKVVTSPPPLKKVVTVKSKHLPAPAVVGEEADVEVNQINNQGEDEEELNEGVQVIEGPHPSPKPVIARLGPPLPRKFSDLPGIEKKISPPKVSERKSSVFERLGRDIPSIKSSDTVVSYKDEDVLDESRIIRRESISAFARLKPAESSPGGSQGILRKRIKDEVNLEARSSTIISLKPKSASTSSLVRSSNTSNSSSSPSSASSPTTLTEVKRVSFNEESTNKLFARKLSSGLLVTKTISSSPSTSSSLGTLRPIPAKGPPPPTTTETTTTTTKTDAKKKPTKKKYYMLQTRPDGTKVKTEISPDDPILKTMPIKRKGVKKTPEDLGEPPSDDGQTTTNPKIKFENFVVKRSRTSSSSTKEESPAPRRHPKILPPPSPSFSGDREPRRESSSGGGNTRTSVHHRLDIRSESNSSWSSSSSSIQQQPISRRKRISPPRDGNEESCHEDKRFKSHQSSRPYLHRKTL